MKKIMCGTLAVIMLVVMTGCATAVPEGRLVTSVTLPVAASCGPVDCPKVGTAEAKSILSLVATGDASIKAAAEAGGITKIHHVDFKAKNVLGIVGKYTTIVRGE